jgi:transposase
MVNKINKIIISINKVNKRWNLNGHTIVRLPPYNCELDPIELVWKGVKHNIRKKLGNQNLDEIKN